MLYDMLCPIVVMRWLGQVLGCQNCIANHEPGTFLRLITLDGLSKNVIICMVFSSIL